MKRTFLTPPPSSLPYVPFETQVEGLLVTLPPDLPTTASELLVALDVDGTLLTKEGVTAAVKSRMKILSEAGVKLLIATGRGIAGTRNILDELGLATGWIVASNGALLLEVEDGEIRVVEATLFEGSEIIDQVLKNVPEATIATEGKNYRTLVLEGFPEDEIFGEWESAPPEVLRDALVTKIIVRMPHLTRKEFKQKIKQLDLSNYQHCMGWTAWMDIMKKGVTKASRLEEMREKLGVSHLGTISVGDGRNDIPMLQWAHYSVAMGGAPRDVIESAKAVTGPVEHDGAGAVLEALIRHLKLPAE
ncbi:Cof-type HAD-IIB family hydrolase [Gleimia sp. 6138-11-ORH1]|uniref:HAD-IIB family hydrolase n=1 Tax=Gleimia sp. 6138-11-ORH1 TaxID=2973937 RepID=UPI00216920B4|nr:HAD family hydrolase [Gleimia sp. 6138-11-ORH1]MCS4485077.1 Cof-type HAD-IIB family hydrolase [Gleimia sp. 6138-11-ORH1]